MSLLLDRPSVAVEYSLVRRCHEWDSAKSGIEQAGLIPEQLLRAPILQWLAFQAYSPDRFDPYFAVIVNNFSNRHRGTDPLLAFVQGMMCFQIRGKHTMFRRSLPDPLISALAGQPFWKHLIADAKLSPEVRDGHVTVYYRGGALLKSLRLEGSNLIADVNPKYVPVRASGSTARVKWSDAGFAFMDSVAALSPGSLTPDVLTAYKEEMGQVLVSFPEGEVVQQIIDRRENIIIDQEIAFQETGSSRDKIDLCHFDSTLQKLVFVEVKRVDDSRLFKPEARPEVLDQLAAYSQRLPSSLVSSLL